MSDSLPKIAVVGGTGALGSGIAFRLAAAGYPVVIGSRAAEKALDAAAELGLGIEGMDNLAAAAAGEVVIVTVPLASQQATLEGIKGAVAGKIVVDTTVPLVPPKVGTVQLPEEGSAAMIAFNVLEPEATVVSAFHNVAAKKLRETGAIECDTLVFGNKRDARDVVVGLAAAMGMRGLHGGPIANSVAAEAMTSVLISINRLYKAKGAGIGITGVPEIADAEIGAANV